MADELTYQLRISLANGNVTDAYSSGSLRADQSTTARLVHNTQPITTTEIQLDPGDVLTPGYCVFANLSETDTDVVEVGNYTGGTFYPFLKLKFGEQMMCRVGIPAAQLYAKSNNASGALLFYIIYND